MHATICRAALILVAMPPPAASGVRAQDPDGSSLAARVVKATSLEVTFRGKLAPSMHRRPDFIAWARGQEAESIGARPRDLGPVIAELSRCLSADRRLDRSWHSERPMLWLTLRTADGETLRLWTGVAGMPIYAGKDLVGVGSPELDALLGLCCSPASVGRALRAPANLAELRGLPATIRELHLHNLVVDDAELPAVAEALRRFERLDLLSLEADRSLPWSALAEVRVATLAVDLPADGTADWETLSKSPWIRALRLRWSGGGAPAGWSFVRGFPELRSLSLHAHPGRHASIDETLIEPLCDTRIAVLAIHRVKFAAEWLAALATIPALRDLTLDTGVPSERDLQLALVRAAGWPAPEQGEDLDALLLEQLQHARQLRRLRLVGLGFEEEALAAPLRQKLPQCEVIRDR